MTLASWLYKVTLPRFFMLFYLVASTSAFITSSNILDRKHSQQYLQTRASVSSLGLESARITSNVTSTLTLASGLPVTIERITNENDLLPAADICVDAFFAETDKSLYTNLGLVENNLRILRKEQYGNLQARFQIDTAKAMKWKYRVVNSAYFKAALATDVVVVENTNRGDFSIVHSAGEAFGNDDTSASVVPSGTIIGFVELEYKRGMQYGMGKNIPIKELRPVLANLAVDRRFRGRGIGKLLVSQCEEEAASWSEDEVVLLVESDNAIAMEMYDKLGYVALFEDKAAKRYDASGPILRSLPCSKVVMRKELVVSEGDLDEARPEQADQTTSMFDPKTIAAAFTDFIKSVSE